MFKRIFSTGSILAACAAFMMMAAPLQAQSIAGCKLTSLADPPREVLRCGSGLSIEAEQGAQYRLVSQNKLEVTNRAVLVDVTPGRRGGFQVLTPHAIASVRGTLYAVDVKGEKTETDVFVSRGKVGVENRSTRERATLGPGEGSDVIPGKPIDAHVWAAERVQKLMARFGR